MHCYGHLSADRKHFSESREGYTYVSAKHHKEVAPKIFALIKGPCGDLQKWNMKIRRKIKKIPNARGQDQDFLDLDALIEAMLDESRKQRKLYQKDLMKQFARHMETQIG